MQRVLFEYLGGSRLFDLSDINSDVDKIVVFLDYAERLSLKPQKRLSWKEETPERDYSPSEEVEHIELGEFLLRITQGHLKLVEVSETRPLICKDNELWSQLAYHYFVPRFSYVDMYQREVRRRYNTLFPPVNVKSTKQNPELKNFNERAGYDTKYAAHLFRVLHAAYIFYSTGDISTNFTYIREEYFRIKEGLVPLGEFRTRIDALREKADTAALKVKESDFSPPAYPDPEDLYRNICYDYIKNGL